MSRWLAAVLGVAVLFQAGARAERVVVGREFAGSVPAGWAVAAGARDGQVNSERAIAEGTGVLRVAAVRGPAEVVGRVDGPIGGEGKFYRVTLRARSVGRAVVTLGVRPAEGSKKFVWSARREVPEVLSEQGAVFEVGTQPGPVAVVVQVPEGGSIELASLQLVEMSRAELIEGMKREYPKGGTRQNLLRISRFPQGVESGGAIGRDLTDEAYEVAGDKDVVGPSGAPALRIKCAQPLRFFLPPAVVKWPFLRHTASVYVRGHGSGTLGVIGDGVPEGSQVFSVDGDDWKRVSVVVTPGLLAREHQVVLDAAGLVWADAFQLEPGEAASEYVKRPEVSLGLPATDASVVRIHFDDDPAIVNFVVTGAGESDSLDARVTNIYGETRDLPDVALVASAGEGVSRGSLQYEVFQGKSFGAFRVEAWVEDSAGRTTSPVNEFVITRLPRARAWDEDAPDSPFGVHMGPTHRQMVLAKAVGINWARLHDAGVDAVGWGFVEREKGQWRWRDDNVKRYRDHHVMILGGLQQSPGWASGLGHPADDYWDKYLEPQNLGDWENYVRHVTGHYKDSIQAWDVWNEPWLDKFFMKWDTEKQRAVRSPTAPADYARLSDAAFKAAKSVSPTFKVMGLNSTGGSHGGAWSKGVAEAGGLAPCDVYDYHSYTNELAGYPGDVVERHYQDALGPVIAKLGGKLDKPVWMTEGTGENLSITGGFYKLSAPGEDPEDVVGVADKLVRYEVSLLAQGVSKVFLYHTNVGGEFRPGPGSFQSLVTDDGYPDPSAAAAAVLAWHVEGKKFVKRIEVAKGVYAAIFRGEERSVAVITSAPAHEAYALPADVIAVDVRDLFGNDLPGGAAYDGRVAYVDIQGTDADLEKTLAHGGTKRSGVSTPPPPTTTTSTPARPTRGDGDK